MARAMATAGRSQRRVSQQRISKDQLLDAAEEVFADKGFYATTLKEIAELAEVAVGSLYSFFAGKDDLFAAVFHRRGEEFVPAMRALLTSDAEPVEQLHALAEYQIEFFRQHPAFGRLFLRASGPTQLLLEPDRDDASRARFAEAMRLEAALFERGQAAGQLRAGWPGGGPGPVGGGGDRQSRSRIRSRRTTCGRTRTRSGTWPSATATTTRLWCDPAYGAKTRWEGPIAPPALVGGDTLIGEDEVAEVPTTSAT